MNEERSKINFPVSLPDRRSNRRCRCVYRYEKVIFDLSILQSNQTIRYNMTLDEFGRWREQNVGSMVS